MIDQAPSGASALNSLGQKAVAMNSLMESWPRKHRITVDEYYRMAEVGLLAPDARVELIEGEIIDMAPIGTDHGSVVSELARLFILAAGDRARVHIQSAVRLDRASEPQPDLAVLVPRMDKYRHVHPVPADILLLIEVSDSTLRYDRDMKVPLYARHGIPEAWIVDLQNNVLRWYREPQGGVYLEQGEIREPGTLSPGALPDISVDLTGVLTA
jgi:Uma2 family endonuclease